MQVQFLIVGQGLCGTWLSWFFAKENTRFVVIDNNERTAPSKVSAGIINPVTGRRMVRVWMAEQVLAFAHDAYTEIGRFLDIVAISQKNMVDFFPNVHQRQVFLERIEEGENYLQSYPEQNQFNEFFNYSLGCGEIRSCYMAQLQNLLPGWRQHLLSNGRLFEEIFQFEDLVINKESIGYHHIHAEKIIFCDGLTSFENPFFKLLPFAPNKGETLIVEVPGLPPHHIYKKGFVLAPLEEGNLFWFGSNYKWEFPHANPTDEFYEQAQRHLQAWLRVPFKVLEHKASIRPATLERRPFVGLHPQQKNLGILNGMGTKGCSLAPWFANELVQNLVSNKDINPHADINRFQKILSS